MGALFIGWILIFSTRCCVSTARRNPKADYVGIKGHASNYIELVVVAR